MTASTNKAWCNLYIKLSGTTVTMIETIGDYDCIKRRSFDTEDEAADYYKAIGGLLNEEEK